MLEASVIRATHEAHRARSQDLPVRRSLLTEGGSHALLMIPGFGENNESLPTEARIAFHFLKFSTRRKDPTLYPRVHHQG